MPELRKDPVTGRWVIIATDRAKRPTDFARATVELHPNRICPFCPGNETKTPPEILVFGRNGSRNLSDWSLRVVPNKFPALRVEGELQREGEGLYDRITGIGAHEVIIESPDHMSTLSTVPEKRVEDLYKISTHTLGVAVTAHERHETLEARLDQLSERVDRLEAKR